jgi:hypothetical protein
MATPHKADPARPGAGPCGLTDLARAGPGRVLLRLVTEHFGRAKSAAL